MPIAFIVASLRAAIDDIEDAAAREDVIAFRFARDQALTLVDELERHDGAREREAANDG